MSRLPRAPGGFTSYVYDIEVFPNFFFAAFTDGERWFEFGGADLVKLAQFCVDDSKVMIGFNNFDYDDAVIRYLVTHPNASPSDIYELSCRLIDPKGPGEEQANLRLQYSETPWQYSIDYFTLINTKGSLKEHECRDGSDIVLDSPADFNKPLAKEQVADVKRYCRYDVSETARMVVAKWDLIDMRERLDKLFSLGNSIYVKTEAKLAQHVFVTLHTQRTGERKRTLDEKARANPANRAARFNLSDLLSRRLRFTTAPFQRLLSDLRASSVEGVKKDWKIVIPRSRADERDLSKPQPLGGLMFKMGVGGIHSCDAPGRFSSTEDALIVDLDVTSYYPNLIIAENMYPAQIGPAFVADMIKLRDIRVAAKRSGDKTTNEAMKIVINSTFGKLNDIWSPIRSTPHAHMVTINGQLFILMLVETLQSEGFEVLSANTDGVTLVCDPVGRYGKLMRLVRAWEKQTKMSMEATIYDRYMRRDINAYLAVSSEGKVKRKGIFNPESGKGDGRIIRAAVEEYLLKGVDPAETVTACEDIKQFLFYQRVKNGGNVYHGEELMGKTVRWYASLGGDPIRRKNPKGTWAIIPNGHSATLALDITGLTIDDCPDIDRAHYIEAAQAIIDSTLPKAPKVKKTKKTKP